MPELLTLGISHKTAPLALRERVAMTEGRVATVLRELIECSEIREAAAVSTCNRTELYLCVGDEVEAESAGLAALATQAGIQPTELAGRLYALRSEEAARHLFRVAAGLESVVLGEAEIQGQVRRAYELALVDGASGPLLNHLFRAALHAGGRVRSETTIGRRGVSLSSVAVELAEETLGGLDRARVLLVGAGETAEIVARALAKRGASTAYVANRHRDRAEALAERHGGEAMSLEQIPERLSETDLVITATLSPHHVIESGQLEAAVPRRSGRPLVLIDLAVPRDLDPGCSTVEGANVFDIDDLQRVVERNSAGRAGDLDGAEQVVESEVARFRDWMDALQVVPTVAALRQRADAVVREVLEQNESRWEGLTDADRVRLEALADAVTKRLLHEPIRRLKLGDETEAQVKATVLRDLFGLDGEGSEDLEGDALDGVTGDGRALGSLAESGSATASPAEDGEAAGSGRSGEASADADRDSQAQVTELDQVRTRRSEGARQNGR